MPKIDNTGDPGPPWRRGFPRLSGNGGWGTRHSAGLPALAWARTEHGSILGGLMIVLFVLYNLFPRLGWPLKDSKEPGTQIGTQRGITPVRDSTNKATFTAETRTELDEPVPAGTEPTARARLS